MVLRADQLNGLWRWRESILGAFVALSGIFWAVTQTGIFAAVGMSLGVVGALLLFGGLQKTRFRVQQSGPGVVQVQPIDGQVTYFGPKDGGSVSIEALESLTFDPQEKPAQWVLCENGGAPLRIPTHAKGADRLFQIFAALDGIRTDNLLGKLRSNPEQPILVWHQNQRIHRS